MGLLQTKKLLHSEGNRLQNKKTAFGMEETFVHGISDEGLIGQDV